MGQKVRTRKDGKIPNPSPPTKVRQTKKFRVLLILPPNLMPPTGRDTFLPNHFLGNPDHRTLSRVEWTTTSDHGGKYHSAEDSGGPSARRAVSRLVYDPPADAIQDERHSYTIQGESARASAFQRKTWLGLVKRMSILSKLPKSYISQSIARSRNLSPFFNATYLSIELLFDTDSQCNAQFSSYRHARNSFSRVGDVEVTRTISENSPCYGILIDIHIVNRAESNSIQAQKCLDLGKKVRRRSSRRR